MLKTRASGRDGRQWCTNQAVVSWIRTTWLSCNISRTVSIFYVAFSAAFYLDPPTFPTPRLFNNYNLRLKLT
ncbi:hypothetical protein Agabi119p4_11611 [Agaricus bisporus var. burnettii]|uniref:Uncharacterized protein n=1 Tax=Agaricus bisporus var. burnettii TaxID=192524 RepID=A0A8H7BZZ5_AGABI|nr:hypothetical protein Agabi119p4_11611 [Agaricus bisporus var. burnettii]